MTADHHAAQLGPTDDGTVMLDIGGDIGALVIHTTPELQGAEIEISPLDAGAEDVFQHAHEHAHEHHHHDGPAHTHVAVRERRGASGSRYAAIYPGLREGRYQVWGLDGAAVDTVRITGGQVAELDWR